VEGLDEEISEDDAKELFLIVQEEFAAATQEQNDHDDVSAFLDFDNEDLNEIVDGKAEEQDDVEASNQVTGKESSLALMPNHIRFESSAPRVDSAAPAETAAQLGGLGPDELDKIKELQAALPGMPISRLKKVVRSFQDTLGYPSVLTLVPILRESLPDNLALGRLKRTNVMNAEFALQKAEDSGLVDRSVLTAMLQVKASSSSLDDAENFHKEAFRRYNVVSHVLPSTAAF